MLLWGRGKTVIGIRPTEGLFWGEGVFPGGASGKERASQCHCRRPKRQILGSTPGLGRSPRGGHGNPLQYSCLENPMDRRAWWATVHRVAKNQILLKWVSMHAGAFWGGWQSIVSWPGWYYNSFPVNNFFKLKAKINGTLSNLPAYVLQRKPWKKTKKEMTTYEPGENICKWCDWQGFNFQNMQIIPFSNKDQTTQLVKWSEDISRYFSKEDMQKRWPIGTWEDIHISNY